MSTTFGIKVNQEGGSVYCEIAFRSNGIRFTNPIAHLLPDDLEVFPLDNGPQGIHTVGDIKREMKEHNGDYYRSVKSE